MTNLDDYKNVKKMELMHKELNEAKIKMITSFESLQKYAKYDTIRETLSVMKTSLILLDIYIDKFKNLIDKVDKNDRLD